MNNQREIKFRVWDGSTMWYDAMVGGFEDTVPTIYIKSRGWVNVDPFIIQQYTGFKDKNGKKVFEGDIIKDRDDGICVIRYDENAFVIDVIKPSSTKSSYTYRHFEGLFNHTQVEVIGNIFENEELIKTI